MAESDLVRIGRGVGDCVIEAGGVQVDAGRRAVPEERVGIVVAAPQPYILAVEAVDGTADLVIKPMTAITVEGITGTARSAEGELVLVVGLSFLMDGCRGSVRMAA